MSIRYWKRAIRAVFVLTVAVAAIGAASRVVAAATVETLPQLVRFKAQLFNRDTGALSVDVLDRSASGIDLINVVAGPLASSSTLVSLEIGAPTNNILPSGTRVRVTAIEMPRNLSRTAKPVRITLLNEIVRTSRVSQGARTFIGFWLPRTGCAQVELTAEFIDIKAAPKLKATVPFVCQE
jgi:hypothetical protein